MADLRYKFVVGACKLLRHPAKTVEYANGVAWTRCPCRHIEVSSRAFRTGS